MNKNNTTDGSSNFLFEEDSEELALNPEDSRCISVFKMESGRDEMNFAEFPLAALTNRPQAGKGSLVFEDSVQDKGGGGLVKKRLTVSASVEYGLPGSLDDEVILGLVQLSKAGGFSKRKVSFCPAELFRVLGWREEGRSYMRLETSLKRWVGVTLYYDNAWWDRARKVWVDKHFHLLEDVTIRRRRKAARTKRTERGQGLWSVTWNGIVFQSFEAGYLRKLDMNLYRGLHLAASKRMYRFLDKRFYFKRRLTFDLRTLACEHIGFGRSDDNSQLKRRLNPAIDELEKAGFIRPVAAKARYRKICRGRWEVGFTRKPDRESLREERPNELGAILMRRGIWENVASDLTTKYTEPSIRAILEEFDELMKTGQGPALSNPPGLLVAWINERGVSDTRCQERRPRAEDMGKSAKMRRRAGSKTPADDPLVLEIDKYLESLSAEGLEILEAEALSRAEPALAEGYRRSLALGSKQLLSEYRCMIISAHVRKILRLQAK